MYHSYTCPCVAVSDEVRAAISLVHAAYGAEVERVASLPKYRTRRDFALVVQPFLLDSSVPLLPNGEPDFSYAAPDCFHFSGTPPAP